MYKHRHTTPAAIAAIALASLLAACNRPATDPTVGQTVDRGVARTGQAVERATDTMASKTNDAAITAKVKTELARDDKLSALSINVDTVDGRVSLAGTAPDPESRDRATQLASAVEGVTAVENQLSVQPKN